MELADIVEQEPILTDDLETICPTCGSTNIRLESEEQTLTGGDNHHWLHSYCRDCEQVFCHEYKGNNHWYTQRRDEIGNYVFKGVSNCFESYVYTCNKCPGFVKRYYTEMDGVTPHTGGILVTAIDDEGYWSPKQREFWGCVICDNKIETTKPRTKVRKLRDKWTITSDE